GFAELRLEPVVIAQLLRDSGLLLDERELIDRLGVVGHWPVRINRDCYWPHTEESKRHQTKCKNRWSDHQRAETRGADQESDRHEEHDRQPKPVGAEVSGYEAGENIERCASLTRRRHDFLDVRGVH